MVKQIVFLVILGLVAVKTVNAVDCYVCNKCDDKESYDKKDITCSLDEFPTDNTPPAEAVTTEKTRAEDGDDTTEATTKPVTPVDTVYRCLKYKHEDKINRGCTKRTCRVIQENDKITECNLCEGDKCNPGSIVKSWAISSIMLVAVVKFFF